MTKQTWTAVVSAITFVVAALVIALAPIPFVAWTPGQTYDLLGSAQDKSPLVLVQGIETYPSSGELLLTTVSQTRVDSNLALPEALIDYVMPNRDVLPRAAVYDSGKTPTQVVDDEKRMMNTAQQDAIVAGLRAAKVTVREMPVVAAVKTGGPADTQLQPGDLVLSINGQDVPTADKATAAIRAVKAGDDVTVTVLRGVQEKSFTITTQTSTNAGRTTTIGVTFDAGYWYAPKVQYTIDPAIGGGSGGLVFALAIYDKITPESLLDGRVVAGTGTINAVGQVGPIGAIHQKLAAAESAGATVFLVPAANCSDTVGAETSMKLVKVATLSEAITALQQLQDPIQAAQVTVC